MNNILLGLLKRKNPINPNLFPPNIATCTNSGGNTTGFVSMQETSTLTPSTDHPYGGPKSLKIITTNENVNEGVRTDSMGITGSTPYVFGALVYAMSGKAMQMVLANNDWTPDEVIHFNGVGDWQWVQTKLTTKSDAWGVYPFITRDAAEVATFYVGKMVLRKGTY